MRIRCDLFGCACDNLDPVCGRCRAHIYEYDFIERGRLYPLQRAWWRLRYFRLPRCANCGRVTFSRGWLRSRLRGDCHIGFCSEKCEQEWVPF